MQTPFDVLADELGAFAAQLERETALRVEAAIADLRRIDAERELRLVNLERAIADRLAAVRDGAPGQPGAPGASVTAADVAPLIAAEVARAIAELPPAPQGVPGQPGAPGASVTAADVAPLIAAEVERAIAELPPAPRGEPGPPGRLPIAQRYAEGVHYAGAVVTHDGGTWQAQRDTGRAPPHDDWTCIAAAGERGVDGRSPRVRDTFDPDVEDYRELDIVALGGAAFIARRNAPGACPGAGWQLISTQGKSGKPGVGVRGAPGPRVERISVDGEGMLTLHNADGSAVTCDLYPLLSKLDR